MKSGPFGTFGIQVRPLRGPFWYVPKSHVSPYYQGSFPSTIHYPPDSTQMPVIIKTPHGDATEVGLQYFFDRVLPLPPYNIHVDTILAQYDVTGRTPLPPTKSGGLSDNVVNGLPLLEGHESVAPVFESLPACARKLARALPHSWVASLDVEDNEDSEWSLENRAYDALPDAYFLDRTRYPNEPADWTNIVVPGVYSKEDTSEAAEEVCNRCHDARPSLTLLLCRIT